MKRKVDKSLYSALIIVLIAVVVRFYNFSQRINFGPEQADSLLTSAGYINEKFSLLGQSYFARQTTDGLQLFAAPLFNYSLVPLLYVFNYEPLFITVWFGILNLATGFLIWFLFKSEGRVALLAMIFYLFSAQMIYHSMFIWILNYLPLIGLVTFWILDGFKESVSYRKVFLLGILSGIGVGLEYMYGVVSLVTFIYLMKKSQQRVKHGLLFLVGAAIINLPTVLFEVKHDWYHFRTLLTYVGDVFHGQSEAALSYYHLLPWWPLFCIVAARFMNRNISSIKATVSLVVLYVILNLTSSLVDFNQAVGMAPGWNFPNLELAASLIAEQNPSSYNIASLVPSDTVRAYPLRYLLTYRHDFQPESVEAYPTSHTLFVVAPAGWNYDNVPWELEQVSDEPLSERYAVGAEYELLVWKRD